ncbi:transposase [Streptomyces sp. TLI_55]|uniref:transposase n=1 Tax=Streptomyces sp. TLI_55 TaxID=1938861 RepID=UPI00117D70DE|nr:transposase [Streptomyces sp. TLI_55]
MGVHRAVPADRRVRPVSRAVAAAPPGNVHDSVAAREVLFRLRLMHPQITIVWADSIYAGTLVAWAKSFLGLTIKTVSRPKTAKGFVLVPVR